MTTFTFPTEEVTFADLLLRSAYALIPPTEPPKLILDTGNMPSQRILFHLCQKLPKTL